MRKILWTGLFLVIIMAGIGFSFFDYCLSFYQDYSYRDEDVEAVVALTGGKGRIPEALKLFEQIDAQWFVISGAGEVATLDRIFVYKQLTDIDKSKIILEKLALSTHQNALYVREILIEKGIRSIVLVTSNYHMKRALYMFQVILPETIQIIPHAIESENFNLDTWWKTMGGITIAFLEYIKYVWYRMVL